MDEDDFIWAMDHAEDPPVPLPPAVWQRVLAEGPIVALVHGGGADPAECQVVCALPQPEAHCFAHGRVAFLSNRTRLNASPDGWEMEAPAVRLALLPLSHDGGAVWTDDEMEPDPDDPRPRVLHFDLRSLADRRSLADMLAQEEIAVSFIDASEGRLLRRAILAPEDARPEIRRFLVEAELRFPDVDAPLWFDVHDAVD